MTFAETISLLPIIVPAAMAVVILLVLAIRRNHALTLALTLAGLIVSVGLVVFGETESVPVTTLLVLDGYARFFIGLIMAQTAAVALLSYGYLARRGGMVEEYYVLLLLAAVGAAVLAASTHFASFFLGLETLSVPLYTLIGYHRRGELSVEAAFKYLVLAATAASMLLFGMAMVYADLGRLQFAEAAMRLADLRMAGSQPTFVLTAGMVLIIIGIAFKLALAPLHLWTPDVYQGAPAPVTAFVATVSKGAMFALLLRYFAEMGLLGQRPFFLTLALIAVASMLGGNLLALLQTNVKRILAYSSIAHL
ncbi:MAG: NADH-quinone oxidoreductase subunit N, partial [Phycisphaerae bacterium]